MRGDLERWRREYSDAIFAFVRHTVPALETEGYEAALDSHEIAIDAHDEMLRRHEQMLAAEAQGGPVTSDEIARFQSQIEDRHRRSREQHRRLETTHRAMLRALRMMSGGSR